MHRKNWLVVNTVQRKEKDRFMIWMTMIPIGTNRRRETCEAAIEKAQCDDSKAHLKLCTHLKLFVQKFIVFLLQFLSAFYANNKHFRSRKLLSNFDRKWRDMTSLRRDLLVMT